MHIDKIITKIKGNPAEKVSDLQLWILQKTWEGKTYNMMAAEAHYKPEYLRRIAAELWLIMGNIFNLEISKTNVRALLEPLDKEAEVATVPPASYQALLPKEDYFSPNAPIAPHSPFCLERSPQEAVVYKELQKPGSMIRINGPCQYGKTSMVLKTLEMGQRLGYNLVSFDFLNVDRDILGNLDRLLRCFLSVVNQQLGVTANIDDHWNPDIGAKINCSLYLQTQILPKLDRPLVLALDQTNILFQHSTVGWDFLSMLRFWYEQAQKRAVWRNLRLVVAYCQDVDMPLPDYKFPLDMGLSLNLDSFNASQVLALAEKHQVSDRLNSGQLRQFMALINGHPYLTQLTFHYLTENPRVSIDEILGQALESNSIYYPYLYRQWFEVKNNPELLQVLKAVFQGQNTDQLDHGQLQQLVCLGILTRYNGKLTLRHGLEYNFFSQKLANAQKLAIAQNLQSMERPKAVV